MAKRLSRGRPPKYADKMLAPITVRFPIPMMRAIEVIAEDRMDAPDKSAVVRELVAEALTARSKRK
jgi:hypothetical protein